LPYQDWVGEWELVDWYHGGYNKPMGGGPYTTPFYTRYLKDSFESKSCFYFRDTDQVVKMKCVTNKRRCQIWIKSSVVDLNLFLLNCTFYFPATPTDTAYTWHTLDSFRLKPHKNNYGYGYNYNSGTPYPKWERKDNVLNFRDGNEYPGSGGGVHFDESRKFRKN